MKAVQTCLALSLAFVSALASAQALWRDVPAGSSPAEVRQRIAEAQPAAPDTLTQSPQALLEIPAVDVAGGEFNVRFLFEDERLQSVVLRAETGSPEAAQALARRVYTALRARYGLEQSSTSRGAPPPSTTMDRRWLFRRTTIRLQVVDDSDVLLVYGVQPARRPGSL